MSSQIYKLKTKKVPIKSNFISTFNLFVVICSKSEMLLSSEIVELWTVEILPPITHFQLSLVDLKQ